MQIAQHVKENDQLNSMPHKSIYTRQLKIGKQRKKSHEHRGSVNKSRWGSVSIQTAKCKILAQGQNR
jgi:hypothetical protein